MIMIKREAILHIPLSQYAFANTESNLTIRLRTARNDVARVVLWYGDRVPPSNPSCFISVQMDKIMSAGLFDYFDATFETPFERVRLLLFSADRRGGDALPLCRTDGGDPSPRKRRLLSVSLYPEGGAGLGT